MALRYFRCLSGSSSLLKKVKYGALSFHCGSVYSITSVNGDLLMLATSLRKASSMVSIRWNPHNCSTTRSCTSFWICIIGAAELLPALGINLLAYVALLYVLSICVVLRCTWLFFLLVSKLLVVALGKGYQLNSSWTTLLLSLVCLVAAYFVPHKRIFLVA